MHWTKKYSINFLLFFSACIVGFVILEIFLRVYQPFQFRVRGDKIVLPVNMEYTIENHESDKLDKYIVHKKNSLGFRGGEPPENFDDYLTLLTVGGSTTECLFLADDKEWTHVLGTKLKNHFEKLWINNAGIDGQSTFGHIVLMNDYVVKLKPDVVLFLVGINDVGTESSLFLDKKFMKVFNSESVTATLISLANYSEVLTVALNIYRSIKARNMGVAHNTAIDLKEISKEIMEIPEEKKDLVKQSHTEKFLEGYEGRLKKLVEMARENGIEPVLVTQPVLYGDAIDEVTNVDLAKLKLNDEMNGELGWEILELYNDVTRRVGRSENVLVIDLAKELPKSSAYYYDWAHYTNEGAEKVANIIFEYLRPFLVQKYDGYSMKTWDAAPSATPLGLSPRR
jgi:lysophospholipase L1-like esterase